MADWVFTQLYQLFYMPKRLHHIGMITSCIAKTVRSSNAGTFRHPVLSDTEHPNLHAKETHQDQPDN